MTVTAQSRGHAVVWDGEAWRWQDDSSPLPEYGGTDRPCVKCGQMPTPEGYDACLGYIEGVTGACCGHGTPA